MNTFYFVSKTGGVSISRVFHVDSDLLAEEYGFELREILSNAGTSAINFDDSILLDAFHIFWVADKKNSINMSMQKLIENNVSIDDIGIVVFNDSSREIGSYFLDCFKVKIKNFDSEDLHLSFTKYRKKIISNNRTLKLSDYTFLYRVKRLIRFFIRKIFRFNISKFFTTPNVGVIDEDSLWKQLAPGNPVVDFGTLLADSFNPKRTRLLLAAHMVGILVVQKNNIFGDQTEILRENIKKERLNRKILMFFN